MLKVLLVVASLAVLGAARPSEEPGLPTLALEKGGGEAAELLLLVPENGEDHLQLVVGQVEATASTPPPR